MDAGDETKFELYSRAKHKVYKVGIHKTFKFETKAFTGANQVIEKV